MPNEVARSEAIETGAAALVSESETTLVRRAVDGDADAFATLFDLNKGRVYAVCLRMTNNTADADDLTQEAFIQAFRKLATFRGESAFSTWLHRVAVNTTLMHFRRRVNDHAACDGSADPEAVKRELGRPDERLQYSIDRIAITRALETLPFGYRTIFELHELDGYGHQEIAKILRCTVGNSKSQLHKAKQRIRECLLSRRCLARQVSAKISHKFARRSESATKDTLTVRACPPLRDQKRTILNSSRLPLTQSPQANLVLGTSSIQVSAETSA